MIDWLYSAAVAAYAVAAALLFAYLSGSARRPARAGMAVLTAAWVLHAAHDVVRAISLRTGPLEGISGSLSTLGLLVVLGFLVVRRLRPRVEVVGAFIAPIALVLLLVSRTPAHALPVHGAWLVVHITANLVGMAAQSVACALAIAYLIQERQVKNRHLGALFHRLPPLDVLDSLIVRCFMVGLPALTIGVITGHVVAARGAHGPGLPWQQYFAMVTWALFAGVLLLRVAAGWRGRRAAIGTILGFASAMLVLLFYVVRGDAS